MGFGAQLRDQIKDIWNKLTRIQKVSFVAVTVISLAVVIGLLFANKPQMEVLYSGLSPTDASSITAKLKEQKVSYQLADDGATILVNASDVYQLRLDMASEISLKGVVGFETFDQTRFGETDTDKKVRFLVALQGELTRTIEELDAVTTAKVHIALPESTLFVKDEKDATASVLLRLKPNAELTPTQVKSILYFVSHSVEGLKPENVTVMDVNGNLLSEGIVGGDSSDSPNVSTNQLALKQKYEKEFAASIQSMLEKMVGTGKAVVRANIQMDFDKIEKYSEVYGESVLRSEQVKENTSSGTDAQTSGNPADSNMSGTTYGTTGTAGTNQSESSERTRNYEINKTTEKQVVAPGKITQVTLSVIIDDDLTPAEEDKIKSAVSTAAGLNTTRGDQVSVVGMAFNTDQTTKMEQEIAKEEAAQRRMEYIKMGMIPLSIALILGFLFYIIRRSPININKVNPEAAVLKEKTSLSPEEVAEVELNLSTEALEKKNVQNQIEKLIAKNPEEVAKVIKSWLLEE